MNRRFQVFFPALLAATATGLASTVLADDTIFEIVAIEAQGRVVSAQFADFNGDQREDLMIATLDGIPPKEARTMHVYLQQPDASFPKVASHSIPVPRRSAVFDIADLRAIPGAEIIFLRPDGVTILSIADATTEQWDLPVAGPSTVAAGADERGLDRLQMVHHTFGDEPLLLVPQIGAVSIMSADGSLVAQLDVGQRANYYVAKQAGLFAVESDLQLFLDTPKISVGDVDGDGQADILASTRHEIRVFLRAADGSFSSRPSEEIPLGFIDEEDHARGTGSVVTTARDMDRDGKLDLMITHAEGNFTSTVTSAYIYTNRDGHWNIDEPDDQFTSKGALSSDLLLDIDSDRAFELVRIHVKFSVLEVVELLLTRKIDARIEIHRLEADGRYAQKPWVTKKINTAINFDTFRPRGFMPKTGLDLNADGMMDLVTSAGGKGMEVYLGGGKRPFAKRSAMQKFPSAGVISFSDYDRDGLMDFVLIDPQTFGSTVRIGRNTGALPMPTGVANGS